MEIASRGELWVHSWTCDCVHSCVSECLFLLLASHEAQARSGRYGQGWGKKCVCVCVSVRPHLKNAGKCGRVLVCAVVVTTELMRVSTEDLGGCCKSVCCSYVHKYLREE